MTTDAFQDARGQGAAPPAGMAGAERQQRERLAEAMYEDALQRLLAARRALAGAAEDPGVLRSVQRQLDELTDLLCDRRQALQTECAPVPALAAGLERLAEDAARRGRLRVFTHAAPDATGHQDAVVLGVARELLANVVEHARASVAEITVTAEDDAVVVRVADDGRGPTPAEGGHGGGDGRLDQTGLRRRLGVLGAALEVEESPMAGTTVTCRIASERLQAERPLQAALRRERRWSAALGAAMRDGFLVVREGRVAEASPRLCALTGFRREELEGVVGAPPFWPPEAQGTLDALVRDARATGAAETRTLVARRDGSRFEALVAVRAIDVDPGGQAELLITLRDGATQDDAAAGRARLELELGAVIASTNRLRGLLDAARAVTDADGLHGLLTQLARAISEELGWSVVINLYRPAWDDFVAATGHGLSPDGWELLEGATYEWSHWTPLLDERYERRGAYLVPAGQPPGGVPGLVRWTPPTAPGEGPDAWQADDDLLIPFRHSLGHFLGVLSLDAPTSGQRPTDAELDVLVAHAAHAALAVQLAQTSIEGARHAAALERLLHVSTRIAATRELRPMLEGVAEAIVEALAFERVVVEVVGPDGRLRPLAAFDAGHPSAELARLAPVAPGALAGLLDPGFGNEGCFVLTGDEAAFSMPEERRALLASRRNGRGWRAWDDHVVLVPLLGPEGQVVGVIWAGDPTDRLLPGGAALQALHAFADQATGARIAAERYARLGAGTEDDPLTVLGGRRAFLRELDREVARSSRTGGCSLLVLVEVDDPRALGSSDAATEARLEQVGAAFAGELRRHDRAFRLEGSLFALLLAGGSLPPEPDPVARRLSARVRSMETAGELGVRFGTATIGPRPDAPQSVLQRAAVALLAAREAQAEAPGGAR